MIRSISDFPVKDLLVQQNRAHKGQMIEMRFALPKTAEILCVGKTPMRQRGDHAGILRFGECDLILKRNAELRADAARQFPNIAAVFLSQPVPIQGQ